VAALLRAEGHAVTAPTLTGLAERAPSLSRSVTLATHVQDIVEHVRGLGRSDVVLVGHSYGGFPATVAARQLDGLVAHLVLLDAFLPVDGEKLLDHAPELIAPYAAAALADAQWSIPPLPSALFGVDEADRAWVDALLTPQPVNSYLEPARLPAGPDQARKSYIRCLQAPGDLLTRSVDRVRGDPAWTYAELDAAHDAMISAPAPLVRLLLELQKRLHRH
jgi:pimeloyl-ACP methyl ester carboxylesterase